MASSSSSTLLCSAVPVCCKSLLMLSAAWKLYLGRLCKVQIYLYLSLVDCYIMSKTTDCVAESETMI